MPIPVKQIGQYTYFYFKNGRLARPLHIAETDQITVIDGMDWYKN